MTLTVPNRKLLLGLAALALGAIVAVGIGWTNLGALLAGVAVLALIEWSIQLLSIVTEQAPPKPDAPDPRAAESPCPACDYSLHGLPAAGVCPECGQPYDLTDSAGLSQRTRPDYE